MKLAGWLDVLSFTLYLQLVSHSQNSLLAKLCSYSIYLVNFFPDWLNPYEVLRLLTHLAS